MVPDSGACFAEIARVLRPGGSPVFAVPHPFYELFDPESGELARSCFETGPERRSIGDLDPELTVFNGTVADVHAALVGAGFAVERLREPGTADPADYRGQWRHKPELTAEVPPTLVVRAALPKG